MTSEAQLIADLRTAAQSAHSNRLAAVAEDIDRFVFDLGYFPEDLFSQVLLLLRTLEFRARANTIAFVKRREF